MAHPTVENEVGREARPQLRDREQGRLPIGVCVALIAGLSLLGWLLLVLVARALP